MLRNRLGRLRSKPEAEKPEVRHDSGKEGITATGAMLRTLLPSCPVCKQNIKGHFFAQVASTIANDSHKPVLTRIFSAVRQHEWDLLTEFKEWDALADNLVVYAIRGHHADATLLVIKSVFELYASNDLILLERITDAELAAISSQTTLEWQKV